MGKHAAGTHNRPAAGHRIFALRPATVLLSGAVCAAVVGTTPAAADDRPAVGPIGQLPIFPGAAQAQELGIAALGAIDPGANPLVPADPGQARTITGQPAHDLAASVMTALDIAPVAAAPAAIADPEPVPLPTPADQLRVGSVQIDRPGFVPPDIAVRINEGALAAETGLSDTLDATGMDPARSDVIADKVIGNAAVGAVIGNALATPFATVGVVAGGAIGLIVGIPFAPAGLVYMPILAGTAAYTLIAGTATATGALIGGAVGAIEGSTAPLPAAPAP